MMKLMEQMAATVLADNEDCDRLAKSLTALQPLAASIFSRARQLAATTNDAQRLKLRFGGVRSEFEKANKQRAVALNQKTSELSVRCAGNHELEKTLQQLGLKIWKSPAADHEPANQRTNGNTADE